MAKSTTFSEAPAKPYLLPTDLPKALTYLASSELEALLDAVQTERKIRAATLKDGAPPLAAQRPIPDPARPRIGRINAMRAALKAGIKPSTIAKQFGVSKATVAEVASGLANDR